MKPHMVIATFRPNTPMNEVMQVVGDEQLRVAELQDEGKIGAVYLATAERQTVFLEVFAADEPEARATAQSLPMARWWDLDVFTLNPPAVVAP